MIQKHFRVKSGGQEEVHACLCLPEEINQENSLILFSHGFTSSGTESHRFFIDLAQLLIKNNFSCLLFDYRGCGYSSGKFENLTTSNEIEDLISVYHYIPKLKYKFNNLFLFGQSHGSYVALLSLPFMEKIKAACLWGASSMPYKRYESNFSNLKTFNNFLILDKGFLLSHEFLRDLKQHNGEKSCKLISIPVCLIHSACDHVVPVKEAEEAYHSIPSLEKELKIVDGGNHSYKGHPQHQQAAFTHTLNWFNKYNA